MIAKQHIDINSQVHTIVVSAKQYSSKYQNMELITM